MANGPHPSRLAAGLPLWRSVLYHYSMPHRFDITAACNLRCSFCVRRHDPDGRFARAAQLVDLARTRFRSRVDPLVLTGGEPALHPELPAVIAGLRDAGFTAIWLETNGVLLRERLAPALLAEAGLAGVRMMLPALSEPLYGAITGQPKALAPAMRHLAAAARALPVEVLVPLTRWTQLTLKTGLELLAREYPSLAGVSLVPLDPSESPAGGRRYVLPSEAWQPLWRELSAARWPWPLRLEQSASEPFAPPVIADTSLFHDEEGGTPSEVIVRVNSRCNEKCAWCWVDHEQPDVPRPELEAEILRVLDLGAKTITLSGGEPTLYKDLPGVVRFCRENGAEHVCLQTNAVRCAKPDYARSLVEAGLDQAFVSLHGSTPEVGDAVTLLKGGHALTVKGLRQLLELGVHMRVNLVIEKQNYRDLPEFMRFFEREFLGYDAPCLLVLSFAHPISDQSDPASVPRFSETAPFVREALEYAVRAGLPFTGLEAQCGIPPCILGGEEAFYPRLRGDRGVRHDADFVYLPGCNVCLRKERCPGVRRAYLSLNGAAEFVPVEGKSARV